MIKRSIYQINLYSLIFIIYLELIVLFYLRTNVRYDDITDLRHILITATSIFSAIVFGMLLSGTSSHLSKVEKYLERLEKLAFQLTSFRRFLHILVLSDKIWSRDHHSDYLRKLKDQYPLVNTNVSKYEMKEDNPLYKIVSDERYEYRTTKLFLAFLTIVDINRFEHLMLMAPSMKFKYTKEKLLYMHESFNNIWYFLAHKKADVLISEETLNILFEEDLIKQMKLLFGGSVSLANLNENLVVDKGNEFFHETIPEMVELIGLIRKGVPRLLKYLLFELVLILIFGLIIPMSTFLFEDLITNGLLKASAIIVLFSFLLIIFHSVIYVYFESKKY